MKEGLENMESQSSTRGTIPFDERLTCSVAEAGSAIGVSRAMIYKMISSGDIETIKIGRRRLVKVFSLKRLLLANS